MNCTNDHDSMQMSNSKQHISVIRKTRRLALKVGQYVNRRLLKDSFFARHLPFRDTLFRLLTPSLNEAEIASANRQFHEDIIDKRVVQLKAKGAENIKFYILLVESLGDIVACEPICHYLKKIAPNSSITWIVKPKFADILNAMPLVDKAITVNSIAEGFDLCETLAKNPASVIINCQYDNTFCPITKRVLHNPCNPNVNIETYYALGNLLETFCLTAGLPRLKEAPSLTIDKRMRAAELPEHYIVLHCHSADKSRDWTSAGWTSLANWLMGSGHSVVEVGTVKEISSNNSLYFDKSGQRSISELLSIIRGARAFVGIDSGFAHIANAFEVPSVILLGRYSVFDRYFPYSGVFAHSDLFQCVYAPKGLYTAAIDSETVRETLAHLL